MIYWGPGVGRGGPQFDFYCKLLQTTNVKKKKKKSRILCGALSVANTSIPSCTKKHSNPPAQKPPHPPHLDPIEHLDRPDPEPDTGPRSCD